jgi:hypothetical protein
VKRLVLVLAVMTVPLLCISCQTRQENLESPFAEEDTEHVLACVLDLSLSYRDQLLGDDGRAYQQFTRIKDAYFRDRVGGGDRMILSQISAKEAALLWDGKPRSFVRDFPTPQSFKLFLQKRSDPNGSRVYGSMADSIEYLLMLHDNNPKLKSAVLVFSDMEDTFPQGQDKERLLDALKAYGKRRGVVGMYWVSPPLIPEWTRHLRDAGLKHYKIEPEFRADPALPTFD